MITFPLTFPLWFGIPGGETVVATCYAKSWWDQASKSGATWVAVHDAVAADSVSQGVWVQSGAYVAQPNNFEIGRIGLFFDTSDITEDQVISSAKLHILIGCSQREEDTDDYACIVRAPDLTYPMTTANYSYLKNCTEIIWSKQFIALADPAWETIDLPEGALADIKKGAGAITSFGGRCKADVDDADPSPDWYSWRGSYSYSSGGDPIAYLEVFAAVPRVAGIHIYIDWDEDGDVDETWEDVTADFQKLTTLRGRDSDLDRAIAGQASLTLRDLDGKYIRENPLSPLHDILKPGVMCQIVVIDSLGVTWWLFTGFVDDVIPDVDNKTAYVPLIDGFSYLNRAYANMAIQLGKRSGELFGYILDSIGWPGDKRRLDVGIDTYAMAFVEGDTKALTVMQQIEASEFGFLYMGTDGWLTWEDRHYRLSEARCTASQWTADGTKYKGITPLNPLRSVRNYVVLECTPKTKLTDFSVLWRLQENSTNELSPIIGPGEWKYYWAGFADANGRPQIADDVITPWFVTDYTAHDNPSGGGWARTGDVYIQPLEAGLNLWASGCKLGVKNQSAKSLYLTHLQVRGKTFLQEGSLKITSPTTAPATNRREFRATIPFYQSSGVLQGIANHIHSTNQEPNPCYELHLVNKAIDLSDEASEHMRERLISDRIHVESVKYGLDSDCHIEKIRHEITSHGTAGLEWHTWWTVSKADANTYWQIGVSKLGSESRLAY